MKTIHPVDEFWIESKLDQEMMDYVWSQIDKAKVDRFDHKKELVGHLTSSLALPDVEGKLNKCVSGMAQELHFVSQHFQKDTLQLRDRWVNFQKKYDFNPIHAHTGAISFIIWMKIPYKYEDEANTPQAKGMTERHRSGCFQLLYTTMLGRITTHTYYLDTSYEGTIILFPSQFSHVVYPFYTSDEDRISISGNIY
tara:strand:+ start:755 stop:1342 length:588 start_codon:yes stop_codon:yes gene_type:complete